MNNNIFDILYPTVSLKHGHHDQSTHGRGGISERFQDLESKFRSLSGMTAKEFLKVRKKQLQESSNAFSAGKPDPHPEADSDRMTSLHRASDHIEKARKLLDKDSGRTMTHLDSAEENLEAAAANSAREGRLVPQGHAYHTQSRSSLSKRGK